MPFRIPRSVWKAITWAPVPFIFVQHCMTVKQISGRSMQPTLNPEPCIWKDIVLFDRFSVHTQHEVRRGDVVSLRSPVKPNETVVKRVVALPGDTVQTLPPYPQKEVKIPEGYCWVEGDELFWTLDSNTWGPVPQALIDAKLVYILWPLNRFGSLKPRPLRDTKTPRNVDGSDPAWKKQIVSIERDKWAHEPTKEKT